MGAKKEKRVVLETRHVKKQFPKVLANDDINMVLYEGEILSLLGENGAGKSTLMNVLYGLYKPTSGEILLEDEQVEFSSPKDAIRQGLGMVHQHFMLVDNLTVTENIILGSEPGKYDFIDYKTARKEVVSISEKYHLHVDPDEVIENLSVGVQQRVEILKALYRKARILILDEPTAVLTPQEVDELFEVVGRLREDGVSIIIINVRPGEIVGIAGVDGNGQSELEEALVGLLKLESGRILYKGEDIAVLDTKQRRGKGVASVPADRQKFGLVLPMKVSENMVLGFHDEKPFVKGINLALDTIKTHSEKLVEEYDIRTPGVEVPAGNLSGGNQQKVILARELSSDPDFLLVAQPTRGLDVGAIEYIHSQILKMREKNVGILLISLELEEIFSLSDRILVLYEGKIVKEFLPENTSDKEVGFYMTGGKKTAEDRA